MTKSLPFILCLILFSTFYAQSQTLIPKIGGSLSTVTIGDNKSNFIVDKTKNKIGFIVGAALELPLHGKFSLQPELLFHQKGFKEISTLNDPIVGTINFETSYTLNYLELPVLVKVKLGSFYVNAGPSVALGIGGKYKLKGSGTSNFSHEGKVKFGMRPDNDQSDNTYVDNNVDVGIQIGGGYVIANLIVVDLRYGCGLINILNKDPSIGRYDNKSKLRSFQVTIGVPIRLRKSKF